MAKSREKGQPAMEMSSAFQEKARLELERLREIVAYNMKDDILTMLEDEIHSDLVITNGKDEVRAHKCIVQVRFKHLWKEEWVTYRQESGDELETGYMVMRGLNRIELEDFLRQLYAVSDSALLVEEYIHHLPRTALTATSQHSDNAQEGNATSHSKQKSENTDDTHLQEIKDDADSSKPGTEIVNGEDPSIHDKKTINDTDTDIQETVKADDDSPKMQNAEALLDDTDSCMQDRRTVHDEVSSVQNKESTCEIKSDMQVHDEVSSMQNTESTDETNSDMQVHDEESSMQNTESTDETNSDMQVHDEESSMQNTESTGETKSDMQVHDEDSSVQNTESTGETKSDMQVHDEDSSVQNTESTGEIKSDMQVHDEDSSMPNTESMEETKSDMQHTESVNGEDSEVQSAEVAENGDSSIQDTEKAVDATLDIQMTDMATDADLGTLSTEVAPEGGLSMPENESENPDVANLEIRNTELIHAAELQMFSGNASESQVVSGNETENFVVHQDKVSKGASDEGENCGASVELQEDGENREVDGKVEPLKDNNMNEYSEEPKEADDNAVGMVDEKEEKSSKASNPTVEDSSYEEVVDASVENSPCHSDHMTDKDNSESLASELEKAEVGGAEYGSYVAKDTNLESQETISLLTAVVSSLVNSEGTSSNDLLNAQEILDVNADTETCPESGQENLLVIVSDSKVAVTENNFDLLEKVLESGAAEVAEIVTETGEAEADDNHDAGSRMSVSDAIKSSYAISVPYDTCSPLGRDLLQMHLQEENCDCCLSVDGVHFLAHKCVLSARSEYFLAMFGGQWSESKMATVNLEIVSPQAIEQLLLFLYGGVMELCTPCDMSDLFQVADMYGVLTLKTVLAFYVKKDLCHFFHKPCQLCLTTAPDAIALCYRFNLEDLQPRCLKWVGKYFTKIWPTKNFAALPDPLHQLSAQAIVDFMTAKNVLDIIMECNKLIDSLPRIKWTENVLFLLTQLMDSAIEFTSTNFIAVIQTQEFLQWAKVASWKAGVLEEIFNPVIDSLSIDTACRVFEILDQLHAFHSDSENEDEDILKLLDAMIKRCEKFFRTHIHQITRSKQWSQMAKTTQSKILENSAYLYLGDLPEPKAKPKGRPAPKFSTIQASRRPASTRSSASTRTGAAASQNSRSQAGASARDNVVSERMSATTASRQESARRSSTRTAPALTSQRSVDKSQAGRSQSASRVSKRGTSSKLGNKHSAQVKSQSNLARKKDETPEKENISRSLPSNGRAENRSSYQENSGDEADVECGTNASTAIDPSQEKTGAMKIGVVKNGIPRRIPVAGGQRASSLPSRNFKLTFSPLPRPKTERQISQASGDGDEDAGHFRRVKKDQISPGRYAASKLPTLIRSPKPKASSRPTSQFMDENLESTAVGSDRNLDSLEQDGRVTSLETRATTADETANMQVSSESTELAMVLFDGDEGTNKRNGFDNLATDRHGSAGSEEEHTGSVEVSNGKNDPESSRNDNSEEYEDDNSMKTTSEGHMDTGTDSLSQDVNANCDEEDFIGTAAEVKVVKMSKPLVVGFTIPPE